MCVPHKDILVDQLNYIRLDLGIMFLSFFFSSRHYLLHCGGLEDRTISDFVFMIRSMTATICTY